MGVARFDQVFGRPLTDLPDPSDLAPRVMELCLRESAPLEFSTFLVGVQAKRAWRDLPEQELHAWKSEMKRSVGIALYEAWKANERRCDFERPEVLLVYDAESGLVRSTIRAR